MRQEIDTENSSTEKFDGMSHMADRILSLVKNPDLPISDKLEMIEEYCILIRRSDTSSITPLTDKWD